MKNLFLSTSLAWLLCISGFSQSTAILFDKDVYTLNAKAKTTLDSFLYRIKKSNPQQELCLIGYTDSDADSVYNKKLSLNRAAAVKDYFLTHGVTNKIHIESKGENKLINSDVTPAEKALNRRVEIIQDYTTPNAFFENVKKDVQTFEIDPDKDTIIICKEGTQIHIAARSFNPANYSSPVTFQVQEYLSKSDFVLANLSTVHTDGRMIESRGMVYLEAFQNNQAVTLKNNKSIGILFKDRNAGDGTSLFTGSMHHNHMVWEDNNFTKEKNQGDGHSKITKVETTIYKKKFFFFESWSGRVKYSQTYWFDSIKGQPYKIVQTYNEGYEKTKRYKIANDSILMKEYKKFLAEQNQINAREKQIIEMNALLLDCPSLGWINCDRFYKYPGKKIEVVVRYEGNFVPNVVLVFKDINSVMPFSYRVDNEMIFSNIPENEPFEIIGLYKDDTVSLLAQKTAVATPGNTESILFKKMSSEEISTMLKNLN